MIPCGSSLEATPIDSLKLDKFDYKLRIDNWADYPPRRELGLCGRPEASVRTLKLPSVGVVGL